jgi:hypothetical protein
VEAACPTAVAFAELEVANSSSARCPFIARIQPRCDRMTVIGSFSIIADQSISRGASGFLDPWCGARRRTFALTRRGPS